MIEYTNEPLRQSVNAEHHHVCRPLCSCCGGGDRRKGYKRSLPVIRRTGRIAKPSLGAKIMDEIKWKLFDGASIKHLFGSIWILTVAHEGWGPPAYVVPNGFNEPIEPCIAQLSPEELRAIACHKEHGTT